MYASVLSKVRIAHCVHIYLPKRGVIVLDHPPHSLDLALLNFSLFPYFKGILKDLRYADLLEIQLHATYFSIDFKWILRWQFINGQFIAEQFYKRFIKNVLWRRKIFLKENRGFFSYSLLNETIHQTFRLTFNFWLWIYQTSYFRKN